MPARRAVYGTRVPAAGPGTLSPVAQVPANVSPPDSTALPQFTAWGRYAYCDQRDGEDSFLVRNIKETRIQFPEAKIEIVS